MICYNLAALVVFIDVADVVDVADVTDVVVTLSLSSVVHTSSVGASPLSKQRAKILFSVNFPLSSFRVAK